MADSIAKSELPDEPLELYIKYPWLKAYLATLRISGSDTKARQICEISRQESSNLFYRSAEAAELRDQALMVYANDLEEEAIRRAYYGEVEPYLHNGKPVMVWVDQEGEIVDEFLEDGETKNPEAFRRIVLMKRKYDNSLLIKVLGRFKSAYRENAPPVAVVNQPIKIIKEGPGPDEQWVDRL